MSNLDLLGDWARLEGALKRFADYLQGSVGPNESLSDSYARLGLAVHAKALFEEGFMLAEQADVLEQYVRLFATDSKEGLNGTTLVEHSLGAVVLLTGFVEGHIKAVTLEARITEEAEAYARERVKSERVGFKPPANGDAS